MLAQWIAFVICSLGLICLSRRSLFQPRSHGFARFFAFEAALGLVVVNAPVWFFEPFAVRQIFSWSLLLGSIILVIHGVHLLRIIGKPRGSFENTTELVVVGAYRYIRHPMYSSLLLLGMGAFLKDPTLLAGILLMVLILALIVTARVEESENTHHFGVAYKQYIQRTKMFIPYIF